MPSRKQCDFYLLRYVPSIVQDQAANVGVVLIEADAGEEGFVGVRFNSDWRLARLLDPNFDAELFTALEAELRRLLESRRPEVINYRGPMSRHQWVLQQLQSSLSGALQLTDAVAVRTESPEAELRELARIYFTLPSAEREAQAGTVRIRRAIRGAFEDAGVWTAMLKNIDLSQAGKGDNLKIFCGYRPNGVVHMFHPVSLANGSDAAKVLAFSYARARSGLEQQMSATCDLTAVIEDGLSRQEAPVQFAYEALEDSLISVAVTADMPDIAARARRQLRL